MPANSKISRSSSGTAPRRAGRASASGQSRFARPSGTSSQGRFARNTSTARRSSPVQGLRRRGQQQPTGIKKVLSAVLPTAGTAKKAAPSSKKGKAGGIALVAAAAGMAFKNRNKLSDLRRKDSDEAFPVTDNTATPPSTPPSTPIA